MLTLQITQEDIDVTTRIGYPKLDNLDYFWNSSVRCSWTWCTHVIQSPTPLFPGFIGWPDLGDDGLDLCFSLLLACPILSAAGERRRFIVMRGGSVLAICRRNLKVSRRNYCNYYNLKIIHESWIQDIREAQSWRISPWTQEKYKNDLFTRSAALWELRAHSVGGSTAWSPMFQLSGSFIFFQVLWPSCYTSYFPSIICIHSMYERVGVLKRENTVFPRYCVLILIYPL